MEYPMTWRAISAGPSLRVPRMVCSPVTTGRHYSKARRREGVAMTSARSGPTLPSLVTSFESRRTAAAQHRRDGPRLCQPGCQRGAYCDGPRLLQSPRHSTVGAAREGGHQRKATCVSVPRARTPVLTPVAARSGLVAQSRAPSTEGRELRMQAQRVCIRDRPTRWGMDSSALARGGRARSLTSTRCGGEVAACSMPLPHDPGTGVPLRESCSIHPTFQKLVGALPRPARPEGFVFGREICLFPPSTLSRAPRPRGSDDRRTPCDCSTELSTCGGPPRIGTPVAQTEAKDCPTSREI